MTAHTPAAPLPGFTSETAEVGGVKLETLEKGSRQ